ncbi:NAD+ synthase [Helicobacter sp. 11S02629-2]|uniref:NAD+ synthase n=1 Tax=Helicobacter sp. 11S02629-2 TaxID=1476195 RepID=UPI000BA5B3A4|nr:NAD+ synthase [Helicobacter sp. 11S02629-2]PAF44334.1 NAD(+) synthase [Helicobacter sp. 11S02629-2]
MKTSLEELVKKITNFINVTMEEKGFERLVLGLSGGIDSAVVALLCKKALAKSNKNEKNLLGLLMPSSTSSEESLKDAKELCQKHNIDSKLASIESMDKDFIKEYPEASPLQRGNFCARLRMATLYYHSSLTNALVVGTSNKSELLLGYGTMHGDLACAFNPISSLYKSDIFVLAKFLGVPDSILTKPPSADLFANQKDEDEIGYKYEDIDRFLKDYTNFKSLEALSLKEVYESVEFRALKDIYGESMTKSLISRIKLNAFKKEGTKFFDIPNLELERD